MKRLLGRAALLTLASVSGSVWASAPGASTIRVFADLDDDDGDGIVDRDDKPSAKTSDMEWLEVAGVVEVRSVDGDAARLIVDGNVIARGARSAVRRARRVGIQGLSAGTTQVEFGDRAMSVAVCEAAAVDSSGRVLNLATSHASLSRTLPPSLATADADADFDALSWRFACPKGFVPRSARIESHRPNGDVLDTIESSTLAPVECPTSLGADVECAETERLRATADLVDRIHPAIASRSLRAEVGGKLVVVVEGKKAASIRVGGPRSPSFGNIDRYRGRLIFHVVRAAVAGQPAVGGSDASARSAAQDEARTASMLWGQCGVHFGADDQVAVDVVDPPPRYLLAVGCDLGLPASGGVLSVGVDAASLRVQTRAGDSPVATAHAVAEAAVAAGFKPTVSTNARILPGALRTADVLFRRPNGEFATLHPISSAPLSTDSTLKVCVGEVNLGDGLAHFEDLDAAAGTVEERVLVRAYQDDDPTTIDVFIVPSFSKTGRIGESFIDADGTGIQNVVIVDRGAIRSGARSYALAHEIGHVLLDMPGHPDDFGVDRPWMLMDADAADASIFGPRRLSVGDCERAVVQSGPGSAVPLLTPWPLYKTRAKEIPVRNK